MVYYCCYSPRPAKTTSNSVNPMVSLTMSQIGQTS
jgi:hypothetical protein